ncbi:MAG: cupin domain-containing protein [Chitinophagaceae bacterium]|nr:cupin domain-containing protein [Chitinophagaceae bacterium]MCW5905986.1 cupin domain-containing protein [Chitinophagaceae bacterium]
MPLKGQIVTNPLTKDTYEFIETAKDTNGASVILKATIYNKGKLVPNHFHLLQDESFEVISGKLTIIKDNQLTTLTTGEKITLPKNIPHNHYNNESTPVTYIHSVSPALDFDYLIENLMGLTADGKSKNGKFGLMQELVTLKYLDSKTFLADMPIGLQKILMNTIAPIGRLLGYRAIYKKYSGIEK